MEELIQAFYEVMYKYQKNFGAAGVRNNLNAWMQAKAPLIALLRRHPDWEEAEKAVVLRFAEGRGIEPDVVDETAFALLDIAEQTIPADRIDAFRDAFNAVITEYATALSEEALEVPQCHKIFLVVACFFTSAFPYFSLRHFYAISAWDYIEKYELIIW